MCVRHLPLAYAGTPSRTGDPDERVRCAFRPALIVCGVRTVACVAIPGMRGGDAGRVQSVRCSSSSDERWGVLNTRRDLRSQCAKLHPRARSEMWATPSNDGRRTCGHWRRIEDGIDIDAANGAWTLGRGVSSARRTDR